MQAWIDFLALQENKLGIAAVNEWLRPLKIVHFDSGNLYLEADNSFQLEWFEEHIRPGLKQSLLNNNHRPIRVHLNVPNDIRSLDPRKKKEKISALPVLNLTPDPLNPHFTFRHFVSGEENQVIYRFLNELGSSVTPLGMFNPIYLHGASASGKTHLLMALAHTFNQQGLIARYVHAETFTEHVVAAIRTSQMQAFRAHYRTADLLIVDDVHLLSGRTATQEEFFHTFNALHTTGRQVILAAPCAPPKLEMIEPRLISRFEWGIILHLQNPRTQDFKEILLKRCDALDFKLSDEVISFLIKTFSSNLKSLNLALETLILRAHMAHVQAIDSSQALYWLKDLIVLEEKSELTPERVIEAVSLHFNIQPEDLLGKSHAPEFALPRQTAMFLCRKLLKLPYTKIGRIFTRDHSTVMSSVKQIQNKMEEEPHECKRAVEEIERNL